MFSGLAGRSTMSPAAATTRRTPERFRGVDPRAAAGRRGHDERPCRPKLRDALLLAQSSELHLRGDRNDGACPGYGTIK